jgi:hypothetical protein
MQSSTNGTRPTAHSWNGSQPRRGGADCRVWAEVRMTKSEEIKRLLIDMLMAHQAMGRDLQDVIEYLQRTMKRKEK